MLFTLQMNSFKISFLKNQWEKALEEDVRLDGLVVFDSHFIFIRSFICRRSPRIDQDGMNSLKK